MSETVDTRGQIDAWQRNARKALQARTDKPILLAFGCTRFAG